MLLWVAPAYSADMRYFVGIDSVDCCFALSFHYQIPLGIRNLGKTPPSRLSVSHILGMLLVPFPFPLFRIFVYLSFAKI